MWKQLQQNRDKGEGGKNRKKKTFQIKRFYRKQEIYLKICFELTEFAELGRKKNPRRKQLEEIYVHWRNITTLMIQ